MDRTAVTSNRDWWPNQSDPPTLHRNSPSDPMGKGFRYSDEFLKLDLEALKQDIFRRDEHLAGLVAGRLRSLRAALIRMAWHSAGTYRISDGRGGASAAPSDSRPQTAGPNNREPRQGAPAALADQAEVRPQDLVGGPDGLAGTCALESMGFKTFGFGGGREDVWEPDTTDWGPEEIVAWRQALPRPTAELETRSRPSRWASSTSTGRPERQPGSHRRGEGHSRDVSAAWR